MLLEKHPSAAIKIRLQAIDMLAPRSESFCPSQLSLFEVSPTDIEVDEFDPQLNPLNLGHVGTFIVWGQMTYKSARRQAREIASRYSSQTPGRDIKMFWTASPISRDTYQICSLMDGLTDATIKALTVWYTKVEGDCAILPNTPALTRQVIHTAVNKSCEHGYVHWANGLLNG